MPGGVGGSCTWVWEGCGRPAETLRGSGRLSGLSGEVMCGSWDAGESLERNSRGHDEFEKTSWNQHRCDRGLWEGEKVAGGT